MKSYVIRFYHCMPFMRKRGGRPFFRRNPRGAAHFFAGILGGAANFFTRIFRKVARPPLVINYERSLVSV